MGTITDDMSRLRSEIGASRIARKEFMSKDVATALEGLRSALLELRDGVEEMLMDVRHTRTKTAGRARADRQSFVSDLHDRVQGLRRDVMDFRQKAAAEMSSAREAFFGPLAGSRTLKARTSHAGSKKAKCKR